MEVKEVLDRTAFEVFSNDPQTLSFRQSRTKLGTELTDALRFIFALASGTEKLSFESVTKAQNCLLHALQIEHALNAQCAEIKGHEQVIAKIKSDWSKSLEAALSYMHKVNNWVSTVQGNGQSAVLEKL